MKSIRSFVLLGACLAGATYASAAVPPEAQSSSATPQITYRSAFADYRPFREEQVRDWRALNDDVAQTGGHVGIMRGTNAAAGQQNTPSREPARNGPPRAPDAHRH